MSFVADVGGGGARVPTSLATVTPPQQQPVNTGESDAAARARELQRQLEALLEKLREAQRRAEEARKRAIAAQHKAEQAKKAEETAKALAEKTKSPVDQAAEKKAEQNTKLQDARLKKESADADLQDKKVALLKAQVAQKKEQKKNTDGQATPEADQKVKRAQDHRDDAQRTSDRSNLYADYQEKETKAQDAEAKVIKLTPAPGRPSATITDAESQALETAKTKATKLRSEADDAKTDFTTAVGAQAQTEFFGDAPAAPSSTQPTTQTAVLPNDPLHSPLQQLLQVSPRPSGQSLFLPLLTPPDLKATPLAPTDTATSSPLASQDTLFPTKDPVVTPDVTKTLSSIADGKSVEQIAKERGVGTDKVIAEAKAAGIQLESSTPSTDVQRTTVKRGDATLTYTNDMHSGTVTVKGSFADPKAPGERRTIEASQDGNGRFSQTVRDDKTGDTTTHVIDTQAGTRTDIVVGADGKRTETTTDLTGATVRRPVKEGEDYLDVAKAAGLTPEQLLALNPDVDYGKLLKPGQQMVVTGVPTTVKTYNADGSTLEETTASDGSLTAVATSASGRRTVLMGEPDAKVGQGEAVRKAIFDDKKSVAETAKKLGMTEAEVLAALPEGTVDVRKPATDNGDVEIRTLYDPSTDRVVVETTDWQHGDVSRKDIGEKAKFTVTQKDPETGKSEKVEVTGGVGYLQNEAEKKAAQADGYGREISDLDKTIRLYRRMGEPVTDLVEQRKQLVLRQSDARGEAKIAESKATAAFTKRQQVLVDEDAGVAYQNLAYARPGSKDQAKAAKVLDDQLERLDHIDRLVDAADKEVDLTKADLDKVQKQDDKAQADADLQTEFQKWKRTWLWNGLDEKEIQKREAQGATPVGPTYRNDEEEDKAAWKAFVQQQEMMDEHGDEYLTDAGRPARDAWLNRNKASDAALDSGIRYDKASIASATANGHLAKGEVDRLQYKKDLWVDANPNSFTESFGQQDKLDDATDRLAKSKVCALQDGEHKKYTEFLAKSPVSEREDPEGLKKLQEQYNNDNQESAETISQQMQDLKLGRTRQQAKAAEAFIAQWAARNPGLQKQIEAFDARATPGSVRAAEARMQEKEDLLASSEQGKQLQRAQSIRNRTQNELTKLSWDDEERVQKDYDTSKKAQEGHTWLRDIFDESADESLDYTKDQLDAVKRLKDKLASGEISLTEYMEQEDELMDAYGLKAVDLARETRENDEYWSVVDEAARIGTSTLAGIGATILSGGNVAVGFGVGFAVSELWDTTGDVVAATQGRNIQADGHSSLLTFGYKAATGDATWDDAKFTFKDEVIDIASAAVTPTGVGAGMRTSAALTAKFAAKEGVQLGANTTLKFTNRVAVGARAGVKSQAVDGVGRVGVETLHVGLDGQLATEEGDKRIGTAIVSSATGLLTAPITGGLSGAAPLPNAMKGMAAKAKFGGAVTTQFANDAVGSYGTGQLISLANNGRLMNDGETTAAWIQAFPGTVNNIALHPHMVSKIAAAEQLQQQQNAGNPANAVNAAANAANVGDAGNPAVPVAGATQVHAPQTPGGGTGGAPRPINVTTDHLPGLAGRDVDHLVVVDATSRDLATELDTHTLAAEALAPGGVVEFRVALDTQKVGASAADPRAPGRGGKGRGGKVKAGKDGADEGGVTRKGDEAQQQKEYQAAQDNAIRVRLRGVGLENVRITRNANPGAGRPEIVVQASKPAMARAPESVFAKPAYDGYDQRMSYLRGDEMVGIYGSGSRPDPVALEATRNEARAARRDMRAGMTVRNRLNVNEAQPWLASPTMQSVSTGIGTRTNFREIAYGAYYSFQLRSTAPLKNALGKELSVAVRPDEYRRTSMLQWGVLPFSRDTIFTVFAKDLIGIAKKEMFGEGTPGYGVNMRSAKVIGPAADGSGQVVEVMLSVKLDGEHVTLAEGQKDFLGGKVGNTPGDHVKVPSSLLFDRVIEDRRFAPFIPALKKITGYNGVFSASVERRWQMLLKDVIGKGDVVPARFFEQFQKTFADAKYKMQVVVPHTDATKLYDATAIDVRDFVARPNVPAFKDLVAKGHVDPGKALVFVPERGGNHHRTAVPGKPVQNELVDLTGKLRRVPHESTSNVWVIFADNKLERGFERGMYRVKNFAYKMLPESAQRSQPSPHHVAGRGNLIDAMTGGRGRPDSNGSLRLTAVFPVPMVFHAGLLAGSTELRLQMGVDAPGVSKSVAKGGTSSVRVSPDGTAVVDVPNWFPRVLEHALTGSTPLVPTGGTKQLGKFFDDLQTVLGPEQRAAVATLREKHLGGDKPTIGDAKFLRSDVAQDIVDVLTGLQPGNGRKPQALVAGQRPEEAVPVTSAAATRPSGLRRADLNYVDGEVTVKGRPVQAGDIELAVLADNILIIANRANPPSAERIATDVRAAGHPEGKDVVIYLCDAGTPARPDASVPASLARDVSNKLGARVHAVDGDVVLGEHVALGGSAVTQRPNLPLTDVSQNAPHRASDADFDAQKRFWLEAGGRTQEAEAPFSPEVRGKGAWVGDETIDPLHLGIEDRVVDMRPMDAESAQAVFPLLAKELGVSPEYNALGAQGMIDKWLGEIAAGTRYARVIYPAAGSTPASDAPIGLISVHKEALIGDSYRNTLPAALYRGSKPAGETSKEALQARGEVWQFSTYLGANKNRYPGGVVNKAARMQFMSDVMRQEAAKGAPVEAFYSRVSGGAPFITGSDGVTVALKGHKFNVASAFSQESQTVGRGPIAVGYEDSSPFKTQTHPDGEPARHIYIYETDASLYGPEGKGTLKWRGKIEQAFDAVPGSRSLLAPTRPSNLNYLEGEATVKGQSVSARDIELAVPPDSILVMAERGNPPSAERIAADLRVAGHPEGKDVALYLCEGGTPARADAPVPESLARDLSNQSGRRVHAIDGDIVLGSRNTVQGAPVVQRPNLPLTDVSQNAPRRTADANINAQKSFWLEPGGRTQEAEAPFAQDVLDKGAWVGDKTIDPLHLGIEERAVELVPFDAQHARDVLPYLAKELKYSPDYMRLKADGMTEKWVAEIEAGTRMAFVIYPAPGSAAQRRPLGFIAVHKEPLIGDNYLGTRDSADYKGEAPAGRLGKQELLDRGEVWQFSTYLSADRASSRNRKSPFPGGVVNSAAKKQVMDLAAAELARRGEPIDAFYARVHAGAPEAVPALGWPETVNAKSLVSQERMAGGGPLAVVHEKGPHAPGGTAPTRYVAIFETPVSRYAEDGPGTAAYRSLIDTQIGKDPRSHRWLGPKEWQGQPLVHRPADLNYLEGNATVNGRPVPARGIEVAVPEKAFLVMADEAHVPGPERIAADMRAAGYADGQEVALYICRAGQMADHAAPVPESLALQLGDKLGARVHAMEGTIKLGEKIELGEGDFVSAQPKLPLMDVSTGRPHANENFDAQQRYWLAPNGRGERVDAPLGAVVRNMGARVGDNWIDPFVLGIEDRVVRLEQFSDRNAAAVLPSLTKQLAVSPDFKNLGPEGMARKWQQEIEDGTRMAYVVYPAEGSPLGHKPLGIIALHREALVDSKYVKTLPASYYRDGKFPASEVSREDLVARGDVWQFSTYLNADAKQVPGTNKAGKMLTIEEAAAEGKRRGEEVLAFYARVHGGGPLVLMEPHVNANIPSLFGQESMARRGPIAVGLEQGSPVTGGADRYVLIFETDRGLYLPDGAGRKKWTADIQKLIDSHPDPASWLGAAQESGPSGPAGSNAASRAANVNVNPQRRSPAIDPDSVARQSYDALATELGLTPRQADAMRGWTAAHRDAVTGFYDARLSSLKADTVARAQAHVAQSGDEAHYVSADIGNLGGLNAAMNNVAEAANVHFRGLADILSTRLGATDATVVPMRTGGDELGVVVVGIDEPTLATAVEATQRQVVRYAEDHGLADIPHLKHANQAGVGLHIGYTSVSPDKTLDHIFTEADQGVDRSKQHVTTDKGRSAGTDRPEPGATKATPATTAAGSGRGAPAREDSTGSPARGAPESDQPEVLTPAHPTRFATGSHEHAKIDPDAVRLQEFSGAARAAGLDTRQFTGLLHYANAAKDSVTGFYDARQSGVKADTVLRLQDLVAGSDDNGFYVSADIANLGGLNHAMGNVAERANVHFKAMATLFADELAATGATVIPLRTGGDELSAAVVGQIEEAGLRAALGAADQRIARYAQEQGLADIPHPKRKGEKGVGMHMGYAEAMPGRTLDRIFTEADMGVDASKNAAHLQIDLEDGQPVALRTSDGEQLSASRLTVIESDGTRRPMTGAEVVARMGRDMLGRGSSADVYPFGEGQVIKIFRHTRASDPDQLHLLADLPEGATVHPRMAVAAGEVASVRELRNAAGGSAFIDVKGPFLVGDRLALVMPRHAFAGKRLELDLETRTYSGEGSELLNERTARTAGVLTDRLNAADKFPGDPQHLVEQDGSVIGFDPLEVSSGELAKNYHEGQALKLARTGRQNAAQRPAPDTPNAGKVQFVAGPPPERVIGAGGLEVPGSGGVHSTVAGAKWAAIEPMPAPFDRDGSEDGAYVYTTDSGSLQGAAEGAHTIPLEAILSGRQIDAFGRFVPDQTVRFRTTSGGPGRQIPEGLIDLGELGQKKDGPGQGTSAST